MKRALYILAEAARAELRIGRSLIEREFPSGLAAPADEGDRIALEHLVRAGLARRKRTEERKT